MFQVVSFIIVASVTAVDSTTERLLSGLVNAEVSLFTTISSGRHVYHMEIDKYKPGYIMYTDMIALKTSDGNINETIAGNSKVYSYKEGVGEDAKFSQLIEGFTQISPSQVVVSDTYNHCLRQVDRVSRVTSVFAGQCQSSGYQDGTSAKFNYPIDVIVDRKNANQLLVGDHYNKAVRTVDVVSKNVGTFMKSGQLFNMGDLIQDKITGDIYIANSKSLYKLSYNTKSLQLISYDSTGQVISKQPGYLGDLFMLGTLLLVTDPNNNRILKYDTALDLWSKLNVCNVATKANTNTDDCVIESPWSVLLTSKRMLIGGGKKITSYVTPEAEALTCTERQVALTCPEKQVALTSPENGLATFQLQFGDQDLTLNLPVGQYQHSVKTSDQSCNVTMIAEDYRVRRRLELVADYSVDCSALTSTVTRSLLDDVAQQKYTVIEALCGSVCKRPGDNAQPVLSCDGVNGLKIRWPTDLVYTADVFSVPTKILQTLKNKIKARGATLNVVVFGATPSIIFPRKAAYGGYVSISLFTDCINGLIYSEVEKKCV